MYYYVKFFKFHKYLKKYILAPIVKISRTGHIITNGKSLPPTQGGAQSMNKTIIPVPLLAAFVTVALSTPSSSATNQGSPVIR